MQFCPGTDQKHLAAKPTSFFLFMGMSDLVSIHKRHANRAPCTIRQSADVADTTEIEKQEKQTEKHAGERWKQTQRMM